MRQGEDQEIEELIKTGWEREREREREREKETDRETDRKGER